MRISDWSSDVCSSDLFAWDQEVSEVVADDDGVRLTTVGGNRWQAQYVIAADGSRSAVRKQIGARMEGGRDDGWYIVVAVAEVEPSGRGAFGERWCRYGEIWGVPVVFKKKQKLK